jgi:hypothetical protein
MLGSKGLADYRPTGSSLTHVAIQRVIKKADPEPVSASRS